MDASSNNLVFQLQSNLHDAVQLTELHTDLAQHGMKHWRNLSPQLRDGDSTVVHFGAQKNTQVAFTDLETAAKKQHVLSNSRLSYCKPDRSAG